MRAIAFRMPGMIAETSSWEFIMRRSTRYRNYESEFEAFLRELKQQRPELEERQREGRLLLWDKGPIPPREVRRAAIPEVKMKPYEYF